MTCKHTDPAAHVLVITSTLGCAFCAVEDREKRLADLARDAFGYNGDDPLRALELGIVRLQAEFVARGARLDLSFKALAETCMAGNAEWWREAIEREANSKREDPADVG